MRVDYIIYRRSVWRGIVGFEGPRATHVQPLPLAYKSTGCLYHFDAANRYTARSRTWLKLKVIDTRQVKDIASLFPRLKADFTQDLEKFAKGFESSLEISMLLDERIGQNIEKHLGNVLNPDTVRDILEASHLVKKWKDPESVRGPAPNRPLLRFAAASNNFPLLRFAAASNNFPLLRFAAASNNFAQPSLTPFLSLSSFCDNFTGVLERLCE